MRAPFAENHSTSFQPAARAPQIGDAIKTPAAKTFAILAVAAAAMACLLALLPAAGHDQMWHLYVGRLLLQGQKLYGPEIFESNPPLVMWLSVLPVATAHLLHLPETALGKLYAVALELVIAVVSLRLLQRLRNGVPGRTLTPAIEWVLAFAFIVIFAAMPARDFGQRDHLLALLSLPYVLAAALDAEGRSLPRPCAVLIGLVALAGFTLKPHQLLVPIFVETALIALRLRNRIPRPFASLLRPEIVAMVLAGLAFVAAVPLFAANYFSQVVPLIRDTYWAFGQLTLLQLFAESIQLHILAAVTLTLFVLHRRSTSALTTLLLAAGLAGTLAYYIQGTGWYYQQLPALSFLSLALVFQLIELAARANLSTPHWAPGAAAGLSLLAIALTACFSGYTLRHPFTFPSGIGDTPDPSFFTALPPGAAVMTLSTTVDYIMPPIYTYHLTLGQRFPLLIMLPALLRSEDPQGGPLKRHLTPARIAQLDQYQHDAITEDLARWHPALILVERCQDPAVHCQALEDRHDNYLAWFLRDPRFRAAFARYHYLRSSGPFDAYVPN